MTKREDLDCASVVRSLSCKIHAPEGLHSAVVVAVRRYRALCREAYAVLLLAQCAGATVELDETEQTLSVRADNDRSKTILAAATGKEGKALAYELRDWLKHQWPTAMSFVADSIRRDVVAVWSSKDAQYVQASRGWLALQGARGVAQFNWRGIAIPNRSTYPVAGHTLTLKWDRDLDAVPFALPKLHPASWHIWSRLRERADGWELGTVYLNEREGKLRATLCYHRPAEETSVDAKRSCRLTFGAGAGFLTLRAEDGLVDVIDDAEASAWLRGQAARRQELERRRAACGNPKRPWGHRHGWLAAQDVLSHLTLKRARGQTARNHAWTRRIVTRAASWRCGRIVVDAFPDDGLAGQPWSWSQFRDFLKYKAEERSIVCVF